MTLSPITQRRLAIFRQHRRGYFSFWVFLVLFGTSLFAEFIANDRPLLIRFDGHWYVPVLQDYSEDTFGPDFMPTEADYTDPDLQQLDRGAWLDDLAGGAIQLRHHREEPADHPRRRHLPRKIRWAPTTRRATCWRA